MRRLMNSRLLKQRLFLQWYRERYEQFLDRINLPKEEAFQLLRSLPSFEDRTALIESLVDPFYRLAECPHLITKNQIVQ